MKVEVKMTVNVDPEAWAANYGFNPDDKAKIRQDVKDYCTGMVVEQLISVGVATPETV